MRATKRNKIILATNLTLSYILPNGFVFVLVLFCQTVVTECYISMFAYHKPFRINCGCILSPLPGYITYKAWEKLHRNEGVCCNIWSGLTNLLILITLMYSDDIEGKFIILFEL